MSETNNVFPDAYKRNDDGSWTCIKQTLLQGPFARILIDQGTIFYPEQLFMGIDVSAYLEASKK